ncbi:CRISPR-associated endoribonuclease Cas6 [Salegentibacter sp. F188]|uniref:CRISPR-associated endoribonuclease Cas6 n=1 Tax=Autumnicola patrickiae TaxID=3075591 RepID=A0ABU3E1F5_9FLAO|nr:CRISPR-associated endoribonuclease Cas6 [Salegentibacter sp. F188]MDT0689728.1 CRISPR-associated endoribonuclease Cas6 [Salegentibacter sp. F188]
MKFKITLECFGNYRTLPINYQYPLSAAIYKIIDQADKEYAEFLHREGYGKGYKFFSFSDLKAKFRIHGDRMILQFPIVSFFINFHLPEASQHFIKGLFQFRKISIADKNSKVDFEVKNIEALENPLKTAKPNEIIEANFKPQSPIVCGIKNDKKNYAFLEPGEEQFNESLIYNWRQKIEANYDVETADNALLISEIYFYGNNAARSRLITIKAGTPAKTKIRGFLNFKLRLRAEKRFVEILQNCGAGLYNAQGMGFLQPINTNAL